MPASAKGRRQKVAPFVGYDGDGRVFESATEMWQDCTGQAGIDRDIALKGKSAEELNDADVAMEEGDTRQNQEGGKEEEKGGKREQWYEEGLNYWKGVEASVEGVLGGYGKVSPIDIDDSKDFIFEMYGRELAAARSAERPTVALDCGAGIGRVSKGLLLPIFSQVDLVEPAPHFLAQAEADLRPTGADASRGEGDASSSHVATNFFCAPLQEFTPEAGRYDVIWVQWCIGHLTDADLISFFRRAQEGLRPGGLLVLKENICQQGFVLDNADRSVTRSDAYFRTLFQQAGLKILKSKLQRSFPKELFQVRMYALRPQDREQESKRKRTRNAPKVISV